MFTTQCHKCDKEFTCEQQRHADGALRLHLRSTHRIGKGSRPRKSKAARAQAILNELDHKNGQQEQGETKKKRRQQTHTNGTFTTPTKTTPILENSDKLTRLELEDKVDKLLRKNTTLKDCLMRFLMEE